MLQISTIDWQDVFVFVQTVRAGSARSTAENLAISHSTVSRRIQSLEADLGVRLFHKSVSGVKLTEHGETLMQYAESAEHDLLAAERLLKGKDTEMSGQIRLTTADAIANHLLMPTIADFKQAYADIDIEIVLSSQVLDLGNQEVDLALRLMPSDAMPPEELIGRVVAKIALCYYATPAYIEQYEPMNEQSKAQVIGWGELGKYPEWLKGSPLSHLSTTCRLNHSAMQVEAAKAGLGIAALPCFIGDNIEQLIRVPRCVPEVRHDLWMLSNPEQREVARLRVFKEQLLNLFEQKQASMLGR